jgi:hypothetical protein
MLKWWTPLETKLCCLPYPFTLQEEISYKGVVFNEMKGVYSSPDSVYFRAVQQALFPDNTYRWGCACIEKPGTGAGTRMWWQVVIAANMTQVTLNPAFDQSGCRGGAAARAHILSTVCARTVLATHCNLPPLTHLQARLGW